MQEFAGKVAVVTGAASGIGRAISQRCVQENMKVVLADIEEEVLARVSQELKASGANVLAVRTDVSRVGDVEALAQKTLSTFGSVHLLFNNAGVSAGGTIWESTEADWQWVIGVNLWGVIHGLRVFVPIMLAQDTSCHIVNTASVAGLVPYFPASPYHATKHAVVALSENLYFSLAGSKSKVKTSVLCPGYVNTRILESDRNRPAELQNAPITIPPTPEAIAAFQEIQQVIQNGMPPQQVADHVFQAIQDEQFYILTHPEYDPILRQRMDDILQRKNPGSI